MSIIKKFFGIKDKTIVPIKMEDVRVGQIYEFHNGYHTKNKYYAEVIKVDLHGNYFITSIPNYHQTVISRTNNFEYHRKRMVLVGNKSLFGHLLLNQKNLVTQQGHERNAREAKRTTNRNPSVGVWRNI